MANVEADGSGGSTSSFQMGGHMVILQLNALDKVWIQSHYNCNNIYRGYSSIFSGFQIA